MMTMVAVVALMMIVATLFRVSAVVLHLTVIAAMIETLGERPRDRKTHCSGQSKCEQAFLKHVRLLCKFAVRLMPSPVVLTLRRPPRIPSALT